MDLVERTPRFRPAATAHWQRTNNAPVTAPTTSASPAPLAVRPGQTRAFTPTTIAGIGLNSPIAANLAAVDQGLCRKDGVPRHAVPADHRSDRKPPSHADEETDR